MSNNLIKYEQDGLEFYVDEETGLAYAHMKAIARMLGLTDQRTLRRRLSEVASGVVKTAEITAHTRIYEVAAYPASVVFKLAIEFNPELAEAMGACGANVYMLGLAGYQVQVAAAPEPAQVTRRLPPQRDAIEYIDAFNYLEGVTDPIFKSYAMQMMYEEMGASTGQSLPGTAGDRHVPIAVLAREMGYALAPGKDSTLGKWVKQHLSPTGQIPHGRYQVNVYADNARTREVVKAFFS